MLYEVITSYASWGYFDFRRVGDQAQQEGVPDEIDINIGYQSMPASWGIDHERKHAFFDYVKEISGF